jgi:hypothetical protein
MKHSKYCHSLQGIIRNSFVSIGGFNGSAMNCRELYSISNDEWILLPSLNRARYLSAILYMNNKALYAIGGYKSDNIIEVLDFDVRKAWTMLKLTSNEVLFLNSPAVILMSKDKALILFGNNKTDTGVFNLPLKKINRHTCSKLPNYYYNAVSVINKKSYILGYKE